MAKKKNKKTNGDEKVEKKKQTVQTLFGFQLKPWLTRETNQKPNDEGNRQAGRIVVLGENVVIKDALKSANIAIPDWHAVSLESPQNKIREVFVLITNEGPVYLIRPIINLQTDRQLQPNLYARTRECCGSLFLNDDFKNLATVSVDFVKSSVDQKRGTFIGLEMGAYTFKNPNGNRLPLVSIRSEDRSIAEESALNGLSVNIARHLTNLSPEILNPESYAAAVAEIFSKQDGLRVDVWDEKKLEKENCNLILAVGRAAKYQPRLVHLSFRPKRSKSKEIYAFVGKGVTFDTGGLDIKPAAGMRLMKKDMAGSASLVGFAHWLATSNAEISCDIYLSLAENAVSSNAFHPGDVVKSRAGLQIEIHNTDAEGRLVMADAMHVALNADKDAKPTVLFDLATLTGAIKVGLGTEVFGMFSNDSELSQRVLAHAKEVGEKGWPMPIVREYEIELKSNFGDLANASASGWGGALTATLFLEKFIGKTPWVHFDMYGWVDRAAGSCAEIGGSGQLVQTLISYFGDN